MNFAEVPYFLSIDAEVVYPVSTELGQLGIIICSIFVFERNINVLLLFDTFSDLLDQLGGGFEDAAFDISRESFVLLWSLLIVIRVEFDAGYSESGHIYYPGLLNYIEISSSQYQSIDFVLGRLIDIFSLSLVEFELLQHIVGTFQTIHSLIGMDLTFAIIIEGFVRIGDIEVRNRRMMADLFTIDCDSSVSHDHLDSLSQNRIERLLVFHIEGMLSNHK